jgi:hypothetical protein
MNITKELLEDQSKDVIESISVGDYTFNIGKASPNESVWYYDDNSKGYVELACKLPLNSKLRKKYGITTYNALYFGDRGQHDSFDDFERDSGEADQTSSFEGFAFGLKPDSTKKNAITLYSFITGENLDDDSTGAEDDGFDKWDELSETSSFEKEKESMNLKVDDDIPQEVKSKILEIWNKQPWNSTKDESLASMSINEALNYLKNKSVYEALDVSVPTKLNKAGNPQEMTKKGRKYAAPGSYITDEEKANIEKMKPTDAIKALEDIFEDSAVVILPNGKIWDKTSSIGLIDNQCRIDDVNYSIFKTNSWSRQGETDGSLRIVLAKKSKKDEPKETTYSLSKNPAPDNK